MCHQPIFENVSGIRKTLVRAEDKIVKYTGLGKFYEEPKYSK